MEVIREVEVFLSRNVGQVGLGFVYSFSQAELSQMFLEKTRKEFSVLIRFGSYLCCEKHQAATIYLQIVADFQRDFGEGDSHSSVLQLGEPGVHLLPGEEFLQAVQGFQVVWHDKDHRGLLLAQRHAQHKETVLCVLVEVVQTYEAGRQNRFPILSAIQLSLFFRSDIKMMGELTCTMHHGNTDSE